MDEEKIIEIAKRNGFYQEDDHWEEFLDFAYDLLAVEREACAKVCDELAAKDKLSNYYGVAARAIRERGNHD